MTVFELIRKLTEFPPDMIVLNADEKDVKSVEKSIFSYVQEDTPRIFRETEFVVIK